MPKATTQTRTPHKRLELLEAVGAAKTGEFSRDVLDGLAAIPKVLPCRYFYDEKGSLLFERICDLDEYYLTRTERSILEANADEIATNFPRATTMVELGSGSSAKTRLLIEAFLKHHGRLRYVPLDISPTILEASALELLADYPGLEIFAIAAEYHTGLSHVSRDVPAPRLVLFLGSTIGNFDPEEATAFLARVRSTMAQNDRLLLGADLAKDPEILKRAYDDSLGVTAAFNKNLLARINEEMGADFDLDAFDHSARFNQAADRIEMHLVSRTDQTVTFTTTGIKVDFKAGETIHTESSHKYSSAQLEGLATRAGLRTDKTWSDEQGRMAVMLLAPA
jgi:L-histidine N-alpha-methyltransferase